MIEIFDGAMGTMLQAAGLKPGECPELLNITHPEMVKAVHAAYIDAGSTIIETNTFGANRIKLAHYGLSDRVTEINAAAVRAAKEAAGGRAKIAGSIAPTGRFIEPLGDLSFDEAYAAYLEQATALAEAGADILLIETIIDLQEMRAALLAAKDAREKAGRPLPIMCQFSFSEDGRTVTGTDPQTAAIVLDAMGADIIGINCSLGPQQLVPLVKIIAENTEKPVSVQPNAGLPCLRDGKTIFPMTPEDFAEWAPRLVEAGATYVGGCCGTTPAHIAALAKALRDCPLPKRHAPQPGLALTSRSRTVFIGQNLPTVLIGERINPTGRKKLAAEIKEGSLLSVKKEALGQVRAGASVLDVNMGVAGIDQTAAMRRAITEISQITDAPLSIDTSDAAALEAGLRAYPGRALINSVSAEPERLRTFLPLAKKYGAAILCLPLNEGGVPKTADERLLAMRVIVKEAKEAGLSLRDLLLDALIMTIAADKDACREALSTIRHYRTDYGCPITMGLSNISFGLPNRPLINSTFFAMCLAAGLDAPIMNPYDEQMQNALMASAALLGQDPNGCAFSRSDKNLAVPKAAATAKIEDLAPLPAIKQAVIDGEKELVVPLVGAAIDAGHTTNEITEKALTAAMNEIGDGFGAGRIFLPQVLLAAETMRTAFIRLRELLPAQTADSRGKIIMATVKGDVHDLGKNIVSALMANSGFSVIDLGKDVPAEAIVSAAQKENADLVGLCALMTTTMPEIDAVVSALRQAGCRAKVMAGGAAVTEEYAKSAGCDAYAPDGVAAVRLAKEMVD